MNANNSAEGALRAYLGMTNPGYAVLIDAPWGAGKTHFAKKACLPNGNSGGVRYVTLNGVSDEWAFRRALISDGFEFSLAEKVAALGESIANSLKLSDLGSLARDIFEEHQISNLPETIIFDDFERATINPKVLFGLINDFIEHKRKRIILIVNSESFDGKEDFFERKEKLVGKTLHIQPDFDEAFPAFVNALSEGRGKAYFNNHIGIARATFEQAGHQNLRLLRNAVRDCAQVLDRVEIELFAAKEAMTRFVTTYLALSMALAKGEISTEHFARRGNWEITASNDLKDDFKPLNAIFKRHRGADILAGSGCVLSTALGELLFAKGYANDAELNTHLLLTGQFNPQDENPLWKRMIYWTNCSWNDLESLVREGYDYLFETTPVESGPYLHIADNMLEIQEYGGLEIGRDELIKKIVDRVTFLDDTEGVPAAKLGTQFGWRKLDGRFAFGGYVCYISDEFLQVMNAMRAAQLSAYARSIEDVTEALLSCFESDLTEFCSKMSYAHREASFYRTPILHHLDINRFARAMLRHFELGRVLELGQVLEVLLERHNSKGEWEEEQEWLLALRNNITDLADDHSKLARSQLEKCFKHFWKFREPEEPKDEATED